MTQFQSNRSGKFLGKACEPVIAAGKDGTIDLEKSCKYCKDMGHDIDNCLHLQKRKAFLSHQSQSREWVKLKAPTFKGQGEGAKG